MDPFATEPKAAATSVALGTSERPVGRSKGAIVDRVPDRGIAQFLIVTQYVSVLRTLSTKSMGVSIGATGTVAPLTVQLGKRAVRGSRC